MAAPPPVLPASLSTSGYEDGLGRRSLAFDRECGSVLERLIVRPELVAFERALRERADRLAALDDERIARLRGIDHDRQAGTLTVVSEFVVGHRLSDLLDEAAERPRDENAAASVDVALGLLLQLLPALSALHAGAGVAHGAVGAGRTVITPAGQVVLLDAVYGAALERLQLSRRRLWVEFRIAVPPSAGHPRFDVAADIAQAALAAIAITVGRPLADRDYPDGLRALLDEAVEIAQLRGSARFATALQRFFERALPLPSRRIYAAADEAAVAVQDLVAGEMGIDRCRTALIELIRDADCVIMPPSAPAPATDIRAIDVPGSLTPTGCDAIALEHDAHVEGAPEIVAPPDAPEIELPVTVPAPVPEGDVPMMIAAAPEPERVSQPAAAAADVEPAAAVAPQPARRKRQRGGRAHRDTLRSADLVAPPPPLPAISVAPEEPPLRMPTFSRVPEGLWTPPRTDVPLAPLAAPAVVTPQPPIALRVRHEPPAGYAPPTSPRARTEQFNGISAHPGPVIRSVDRPASTLGWKLAAAAALAIAAGVGAGRANLLDRLPDTTRATAAPTVAHVDAPAAPTGSLVVETQPAGARVLIDGQAAGETPLKVDTVATGHHIVTLITSSATLKRSVKVEAGKTASIDVAVYSGWLAVFAPIVLEVAEDGRSIGSTEQGRLMLPPGRHALTFSNKDLGYSAVRKVDIEAGEERVLTVEPRGALSLNAVPWAEVYIDGQRAGETPLANLQVPLGTREILFKHPQFGERRMTTVVTASAPSAVSVDFTKSY